MERMSSALEKITEGAGTSAETMWMTRNLNGFGSLFSNYLRLRAAGQTFIDCSKACPPAPEIVLPYASLSDCPESKVGPLLKSLCVLKLNGGMFRAFIYLSLYLFTFILILFFQIMKTHRPW